MKTTDFIQSALRTIDLEQKAVAELRDKIDQNFESACHQIIACRGRTIVIGIGKSGHIGRKIAATLASTGTPAFFVHPGEASHGDFGMITRDDVIIAISNSGKTAELLTLVPLIKRLGCPLICMTGDSKSPLAEAAKIHLDISVSEEACPLKLAPTSSTTVTLVVGDALALALLEARGFSEEDFAFAHPGGQLGRKLLWRVSDLMHIGAPVAVVQSQADIRNAIAEITSKGFGMTCIVDGANTLLGIFTDGDLRRCVHQGVDLSSGKIDSVMTKKPRTVSANTLAVEALNMMEEHKITALAVTGENDMLLGILHMHDLLRAGII